MSVVSYILIGLVVALSLACISLYIAKRIVDKKREKKKINSDCVNDTNN